MIESNHLLIELADGRVVSRSPDDYRASGPGLRIFVDLGNPKLVPECGGAGTLHVVEVSDNSPARVREVFAPGAWRSAKSVEWPGRVGE